MKGRETINSMINFSRPVILAALMLTFSAAPGRSQTGDPQKWVRVSINAGETYVIENIKPGTRPAFRIDQNPNAFLSYDTAPGKLTMLGTDAGRWVVTVTNTSVQTAYYDLNALAVAKAGAPLPPGNLPPSITESDLAARPCFGSSISPTTPI